jgi:tRNA1(Val) A37 N6-methylase TrmN6
MSKTVLDPSCGRGEFLVGIAKRMMAAGNNDVLSHLYAADTSNLNLQVTKKRLEHLARTHGTQSTLEFSNLIHYNDVKELFTSIGDMRFDVIIGNPPFQRNDIAAKRWTLWEPFVEKSLETADHVAMVVPQSLTSPGRMFEMVREKCKVLNIDVSKHFNISSTFCYFVADIKSEISVTSIITSDGVYEADLRSLPFLPIEINGDSMDKLKKLMSRTRRKWRRGELHTSNKDLFTDNGLYEVMHTNAQTLRTDVTHDNLKKIRVGVSLSGYPKFVLIHGAYLSQACMWTEFDDIADAQIFADECNDAEIQELLKLFKWSGWNSKQVIEYL